MKLRNILSSFLLVTPILAYSDAEIVTQYALKGCTNASQYHLALIGVSLRYFKQLEEAVQADQISSQTAQEYWDSSIESVSDELFKFNDEKKERVSSASESGKLMLETRAIASDTALYQTISNLAGKEHNETRVNRIFTAACETKVISLTESYRVNQRNRRAEMDRRLDQMERESQAESRRADRERSQRLINQGLGILNQNNSRDVQPSGCFFQRETVSGFHKTCYYRCVTGNIPHVVGSTELCPLTR